MSLLAFPTQSFLRRAMVPTLVCTLAALSLPSCKKECEGYFVGHSSLNHLVVSDWPYGDGSAAGVWDLTLFPSEFGTNCVEFQSGLYEPENYAYTLEFLQDGEDELMKLYVDGTLFATGSYYDESADDIPDQIEYETGERTDDTRPAGAISYVISGFAKLEANKSAGSLTWDGEEEIRVVDSRDPDVPNDCTFRYEISGTKVCDE